MKKKRKRHQNKDKEPPLPYPSTSLSSTSFITSLIKEEDINAFERDGAVCVRGVFSQTWLDLIETGIKKNLQPPYQLSTRFTPEGKSGGFYDDFGNWGTIAEYKRFAKESPAGEMVGRLMRSRSVRFFS